MWYLVGRTHDFRTFRVDRVDDVEVTADLFERLPAFDLEDHLAQVCDDFADAPPQYLARLRVRGSAAARVRWSARLLDLGAPDGDGWRDATIDAESHHEAVAVVLSLAPNVIVVEPTVACRGSTPSSRHVRLPAGRSGRPAVTALPRRRSALRRPGRTCPITPVDSTPPGVSKGRDGGAYWCRPTSRRCLPRARSRDRARVGSGARNGEGATWPDAFGTRVLPRDLSRSRTPCEVATDQATVTRRSQERSQLEQGGNRRTIQDREFNDATDRHRRA